MSAYQDGVEALARRSLQDVFRCARKAIERRPGCRHFDHAVNEMLNMELRPLTAKWHRAQTEGRLNARDVSLSSPRYGRCVVPARVVLLAAMW